MLRTTYAVRSVELKVHQQHPGLEKWDFQEKSIIMNQMHHVEKGKEEEGELTFS